MRLFGFIFSVLLLTACSKPVFKSKWINERSPENFVTRFETSKGSFDVEIKREWSPKAVDRFYQLLNHHFYDNAIFYRGVPNFVVQFGSSDTVITSHWDKYKIPDEDVKYGNKRGSISFARGGKETRGRELFINLKDNSKLDTINYEGVKGFPAFGNVTAGMNVVDSIYTGYGDNTMSKLDSLYINRQQFLKRFPKLDVITKAYILKTK